MLSFSGLVTFTNGVLSGTKYLATQNMTLCQNLLITEWDNNFWLAVNETMQLEFFPVGWALLDIMYNLDPITVACYTSFTEVVAGVTYNVNQLTPKMVLMNFIY